MTSCRLIFQRLKGWWKGGWARGEVYVKSELYRMVYILNSLDYFAQIHFRFKSDLMNNSKLSLGNEYKKTFFNENFVVKVVDGNVNKIFCYFLRKKYFYISTDNLFNYHEKT